MEREGEYPVREVVPELEPEEAARRRREAEDRLYRIFADDPV